MIKTKIFFDNSLIWVAIAVGITTVVVSEKIMDINNSKFDSPISNLEQRDKKLTFGLYVTPDPDKNPIYPPERFTGYHTALDLEIFPEEENQEVAIYASCDGKVLVAREASGYGGVIVHSCKLDDQNVTVLYGHLNFRKFEVKAGDRVHRGQKLGVLGDKKTEESGFNRKHLHFGVHKGEQVILLGYVASKKDLDQFIDPLPLLLPPAK